MAGLVDLLGLMGGGKSSASDLMGLLGGQAGVSESQAQDTLLKALPSLLSSMQNNASTKTGADSLLKALGQHDLDEKDIVKLIKSADEEDGVKILNHIYGSKEKAEETKKEVANAAGIDVKKAAKLMALAAPVLLTVLAKTNKKSNKTETVSNADGLADMLGTLAGLAGGKSSASGLGSLIGALAGGGSKKNDGLDIGDILGLLMK